MSGKVIPIQEAVAKIPDGATVSICGAWSNPLIRLFVKNLGLTKKTFMRKEFRLYDNDGRDISGDTR